MYSGWVHSENNIEFELILFPDNIIFSKVKQPFTIKWRCPAVGLYIVRMTEFLLASVIFLLGGIIIELQASKSSSI
jgi:hypothetical protein